MFNDSFEDSRAESAYIHESAIVESPCQIGERSSVMHFSRLMGYILMGDDSYVGHNVSIGSGVILGNHVNISHNSSIISGVILEDNVYCGANTVFTHPRRMRAHIGPVSKVSPTLVGKGSNIGPNATIGSGFKLGQFCFIEAGTVVDQAIPDYAVVGSDPLILKAWRCVCGEKLVFKQQRSECQSCGKLYVQSHDTKVLRVTDKDDPLWIHPRRINADYNVADKA